MKLSKTLNKIGVIAIFSLAILMLGQTSAQAGYKESLSNSRLIMDGASCAGIEFSKDSLSAKWRNEIECQRNDKTVSHWRVIWIDDDDFILVQRDRNNETSSTSNMLYKVKSLKKNRIVLVDYWTGWGKHAPSLESFSIER